MCPSIGGDPVIRAQFGQYERRSASPGSASRYLRMVRDSDVRAVLPDIASPTLVIHPAGDRAVPVGIAHYIAEHIPNAELCLLDTEDHLFWFSEAIDEISDAVETFPQQVHRALGSRRRTTVVRCARVESVRQASGRCCPAHPGPLLPLPLERLTRCRWLVGLDLGDARARPRSAPKFVAYEVLSGYDT